MAWIRTVFCPSIATAEKNDYCLCDDSSIDLTPGTVGDKQTFSCLPCTGYGVQPADVFCCNLSGTISE